MPPSVPPGPLQFVPEDSQWNLPFAPDPPASKPRRKVRTHRARKLVEPAERYLADRGARELGAIPDRTPRTPPSPDVGSRIERANPGRGARNTGVEDVLVGPRVSENNVQWIELVRKAFFLAGERAKFGERCELEADIQKSEKILAQRSRIAEETGRIYNRARSRMGKPMAVREEQGEVGGNALRRLKSTGGDLRRMISNRKNALGGVKGGDYSAKTSSTAPEAHQKKQVRRRWFGQRRESPGLEWLAGEGDGLMDGPSSQPTTGIKDAQADITGQEELLAELHLEFQQLGDDAETAFQRLRIAKDRLHDLEKIESQLKPILDRFYGRRQGWETDPVACRMVAHIADMSESAVEAERDLWDRTELLKKMRAACEDYKAGERYVAESVTLLRSMCRDLEAVAILVAEKQQASGDKHGERGHTLDIFERLESASVTSRAASSKLKLAVCLVPAMPDGKSIALRARSLLGDMDGVGSNLSDFVQPRESLVSAVVEMAEKIVADATAVEQWIGKAIWSISRDGNECKGHVKLLEREVMEERLALLRLNCEHEVAMDDIDALRLGGGV